MPTRASLTQQAFSVVASVSALGMVLYVFYSCEMSAAESKRSAGMKQAAEAAHWAQVRQAIRSSPPATIGEATARLGTPLSCADGSCVWSISPGLVKADAEQLSGKLRNGSRLTSVVCGDLSSGFSECL